MQAQQADNRGAATPLVLLMALFALLLFMLMGAGTWSDLVVAGEDYALTLYYAREGVLAASFLAYAAFARWRKAHSLSRRAADVAAVVMAVLFAACIASLNVAGAPAIRVLAVFAVEVLVGVSGGMVYERIAIAVPCCARELASSRGGGSGDVARTLGLVIGGGGAIAVVVQFALQFGISLEGGPLGACFAVCFCLVMWLVRKVRPVPAGMEGADGGGAGLGVGAGGAGARPSAPAVAAATGLPAMTLVCMVIAAACLFALLPFYEFVVFSSGAEAIFYKWPRLFGALGYIVIGATAYLGGRPAASVAILVAALFAVILSAQAALMETGALTTALFYFLVTAVFAWSCIAFMSAAAHSECPALLAPVGRIMLDLVTFAELLFPVIGDLPLMAVLTISLVLLAVVVIAMVKGGLLAFAGHGAGGIDSSREGPAPSAEERLQALVRECGLTDREGEVLAALVLTEEKNQQIADDLGMSRRQLQNHISSIYKKTDTTTRAGLVMRVNGNGNGNSGGNGNGNGGGNGNGNGGE